MKIIKWVGHPVVLIIVYLLLIIEGDNFGGFYLLYLVLALPHGVPYAAVSAIGALSLVAAFNMHSESKRTVKHVIYLFSFFLMVLGLFIFFGKGNKGATFDPGVPLGTFILFGICSLCFLVRTVSLFFKRGTMKSVS